MENVSICGATRRPGGRLPSISAPSVSVILDGALMICALAGGPPTAVDRPVSKNESGVAAGAPMGVMSLSRERPHRFGSMLRYTRQDHPSGMAGVAPGKVTPMAFVAPVRFTEGRLRSQSPEMVPSSTQFCRAVGAGILVSHR